MYIYIYIIINLFIELFFRCQDFIVVDDEAKVTQLNYGLFDMIDKDKKKGSILIRSIISPIVNISVRPNSNTLAICCENGLLYQWDFQSKPQEVEVLKDFGPERSVINNKLLLFRKK